MRGMGYPAKGQHFNLPFPFKNCWYNISYHSEQINVSLEWHMTIKTAQKEDVKDKQILLFKAPAGL